MRTVVLTLLALIAGQLIRAVLPGTAALFAGSLIALAGIAVGNVLLPGLVRLHFPDRIPAMTAAYTTLLTIGGAAAAAVTLPVERALGGDWRTGLGMWAGTAVVALIPWLLLIRGNVAPRRCRQRSGTRLPLSVLARTRVAWALALYFGCQSMVAYVVFGWLSGDPDRHRYDGHRGRGHGRRRDRGRDSAGGGGAAAAGPDVAGRRSWWSRCQVVTRQRFSG